MPSADPETGSTGSAPAGEHPSSASTSQTPVAASPVPVPSGTPRSCRPEDEVEGQWTIGDTVVVDQGRRDDAGTGTLRTGYVVRGDAVSEDVVAGVTRRAQFEVTVTAFRPDRDLPGQTKGRWYITGAWVLRGLTADDVRHGDGILRGTLRAESAVDPAAGERPLAAALDLPLWLAGEQWLAGNGVFSGTSRFEGSLALTITQIRIGSQ
jgi:hypothetical protein